jgi:hypothetical protein
MTRESKSERRESFVCSGEASQIARQAADVADAQS